MNKKFQIKARGCDNVLPFQGHRTLQGTLIVEYETMGDDDYRGKVEPRTKGSPAPLRPPRISTCIYPGLNPMLRCKKPIPDLLSYGVAYYLNRQ
jgi:hypothetical protein